MHDVGRRHKRANAFSPRDLRRKASSSAPYLRPRAQGTLNPSPQNSRALNSSPVICGAQPHLQHHIPDHAPEAPLPDPSFCRASRAAPDGRKDGFALSRIPSDSKCAHLWRPCRVLPKLPRAQFHAHRAQQCLATNQALVEYLDSKLSAAASTPS